MLGLIAKRQTGRAMKLFTLLQERGLVDYIIGHVIITCVLGDPVSLETQNDILELLAYYGVGNRGRGGRTEVVREEGEVGDLEELGEELGRSGSEEAAAFLAREETEQEERSLKDRAHLMQFQVCHHITKL